MASATRPAPPVNRAVRSVLVGVSFVAACGNVPAQSAASVPSVPSAPLACGGQRLAEPPLPAPSSLASLRFDTFGGGSRLEILAPHEGRYVESRAGGPASCSRADIGPAEVESLRRALVDARFCDLEKLAETSEVAMPTDAGWVTLEAHLPGVSCRVAFAPYAAQRAGAEDAASWEESLRPEFREVFAAFARVRRAVRTVDPAASPP